MHKLQKELRKYASKERKEKNEYFFKTGEGEYSNFDTFIGVSMPDIRKVAKQFHDISYNELQDIISSDVHEDRLCALVLLAERSKQTGNDERKTITTFYLKNTKYINNWDLVDVSAHYVLGNYILDNPDQRKILDKLVVSKNTWERRIAMVSTWIMIRKQGIDEALYLAEKLLDDDHDLMHKAVGWMLRESWKKQPERVEDFLKRQYDRLPRTTLRYAIERMKESKRKRFLYGDI